MLWELMSGQVYMGLCLPATSPVSALVSELVQVEDDARVEPKSSKLRYVEREDGGWRREPASERVTPCVMT